VAPARVRDRSSPRRRSTRSADLTTSIRDVAGRAGVSVGTVSNVLNRPDAVSETTRQRVLDAIAALGLHDPLALGLLQEMVRHGVRVPDDLAIVGFDDIVFAAAAAVPLSSVRKPRFELGRRSAQLLLDEARNSAHRHEQLLFEPQLVVRESSMVPRKKEGAA
jgi:DNA-binding LacI/PurR family transcriptional regulator